MKFLEFKEICDTFFNKNDFAKWSTRIIFESLESTEFMNDVINVIDKSMNSDLSPNNLHEIFSEIHKKSEYYLKLYKDEEDFNKKFDFMLRCMGYFVLENCLNEHSAYSRKLIDEIKVAYGNDYLKEIEKIDKQNLSVDGKKYLTEDNNISVSQSQVSEKYIVMKKWQDITHYYYVNEIEPVMCKLEEEYIDRNKDKVLYKEKLAYKLRTLVKLSQKKVIDIEKLSKVYTSGIRKELINIIGGKMYGLVILKSINVDIPRTFIIPTTNENISEDILKYMSSDKKYAVRSSANIEDGESKSFAGMFDSFLNVDYNDLLKEIDNVRNSANNNRVKAYMEQNNIIDDVKMAVVIQEFVEPDVAGIWIGSNENSGMLEWVPGNGEKLVSGKVTPNNEVWTNETCNISNSLNIEGTPIGNILISLQKKVLENNLSLADFEWCVLNNKLIMLQYRPVTKPLSIDSCIKQDSLNSNTKQTIYYGIAASGGQVSGTSKFVNITKENDKNKLNNGDIMMAWFTDPEWMDTMIKSSGIITAMGGFLCHAAIIARELGIPCVTGIGGDAMKTIWEDEKIYLNGTTGEVKRILERKDGEN